MKTLGLIGKSLSHSFSKSYFEQKFDKEGISNFEYHNFELNSIDELTNVIANYQPIGLNVTIPYKESIIPFLDEISEEAKAVGAVNAIKIHYQNGKPYLKGYNTDVFGFAQSIKPFLEGKHEKALILGTGGASKAVAYVLTQLGIDCLYVSRTQKAHNIIAYSDINEFVLKYCLLVVNTTPIGTFPNVSEEISLPYEYFTSAHLVVDLIYNPTETMFLKKAKDQGAKTLNGLSMLHQQAEKGWGIFSAD